MWGPRPTQGFLRGPDDKTKATLVLCPCPGTCLTRPVWDWSQGLEGVKIVDSEDPALPRGCDDQPWGICVWDVFFLLTSSDLTLCCPWPLSSRDSIYKAVLLKVARHRSSFYAMPPGPSYCFVFSFSHLYLPSPVLLLSISLFGTLVPAGSGQGRKRGNFLRNRH